MWQSFLAKTCDKVLFVLFGPCSQRGASQTDSFAHDSFQKVFGGGQRSTPHQPKQHPSGIGAQHGQIALDVRLSNTIQNHIDALLVGGVENLTGPHCGIPLLFFVIEAVFRPQFLAPFNLSIEPAVTYGIAPTKRQS